MTILELHANFTKGEITPLAQSRMETEFFKASAREVRNWMTIRYGGVRRRPGTRYCGPSASTGHKSELIPFVFSSTQAYFLEFSHNVIRFWTPQGQQILDGSGAPYAIFSPYPESAVSRLQWAQSNDVLYLAHPDFFPHKLQRYGHANWTMVPVDFYDGPYLPLNDVKNKATITAGPDAGNVQTVTFDDTRNINRGAGFQVTDIGRHFRAQFNGKYSWGKIFFVNSTTSIDVNWITGNPTDSSHLTSLTWRLGMMSLTTGYPGSVAFFESRLCWGRTNANPSIVGLSKSSLPEIYTPSDDDATVTDSAGTAFDIAGAGELQWLIEAPKLQIGTPTSIRTLGSSNGADALTPRNVTQRLEVNNGTVNVLPVRVGPSTVHPGRFATTLHDLIYDYNINSLAGPDVSTLAPHMLKHGVRRIAFAQHPDNVVWLCTEDGKLCGTTFDRDEKVLGFHQHPMTNGFIETIAVVPDAVNKRDVLGMFVTRTIMGATVRSFEILTRSFDADLMAFEDAWFVDCGAQYVGSPISTVTGLDYLEGQTVDILADGAVMPQAVVTAGRITLANGRTASKITVGLPISNRFTTLAPVGAKASGATLGEKKRTVYVNVDEFESKGLSIGPPDYIAEIVQYRNSTTPMGHPSGLWSGITRVPIDDGWSTDGAVTLSVQGPLPSTVRALNFSVDV